MAKPLPKEDFRALRIVLEPDDFASAESPDPPPKDIISEETWTHLVELPDDVAIRTSNDYGTLLTELCEFETELTSVSLAMRDLLIQTGCKNEEPPIRQVLFAASEDLAVSTYNALTGYYRAAFSALRNVVENMAIGLHLQLSGDQTRYEAWLAGDELGFGWAVRLIHKSKPIHELEAHLAAATGDNFFRQRKQNSVHDPGGFTRRLFDRLSKYTHGAPGFTNGDMWASNGPVFVPKSFRGWATAFIQAYCFCLVACRLGQPTLRNLGKWSKQNLKDLFNQASKWLKPQDDGARLFQNLPSNFW